MRTFATRKIQVSGSSVRALMCWLIYSIALSVPINSAYCSELDQQKIVNQWPSITLTINPDNLVTDHDGSLFLAYNGYIYKYSRNLSLLTSTQTTVRSPISPHPNINETSNRFVNKLLSIVRSPTKQLGKSDLLLSCWQAQNLLLKCLFHSLNDLKSSPLDWSHTNEGVVKFMIDHNEGLHVISNSFNTSYLLISTSRPSSSLTRLDQVISLQNVNRTSGQVYAMPSMGLFRTNLDQTKKHIYLELTQVLPYNKLLLNNLLLYQYVYVFNYENYTYFVLNDIKKPNSIEETRSINSVRLARICRDDLELSSYTEIPLSCKNQEGLYAQTAYLDIPKISPEDANLHVISEISKNSFLCSYSLKHIQDVFNRATSDCHEGFIKSFMLNKLNPYSDRPLICQKNPTKNWCTSATNPYIDGSNYPVNEYNYIQLDGLFSSNFLYSTFQGITKGKEVYFIGTRAGQLTKITADQEPLYSINLYDGEIDNYRVEGEKISNIFKRGATSTERNVKYSVSGTDIYAITGPNKLHRIPIENCQFYTSCGTCLTVRDPLKCVWCSDECTTKDECAPDQVSTSSCPPIIKSFYPLTGPTTGNTKLTILGENFGTSLGVTKVKIANQECHIDKENISSTKITCDLLPQNETSSVVSVEVDDDSSYLTMKGKTTSQYPYKYVKVSIFGCLPVCALKSGATNVTIIGDNLNAGSDRKVLFGHLECQVLSVSHEQLNCSLNTKLLSERGISEEFSVLIDKVKYVPSGPASNGFEYLQTKIDFDCDDNAISISEDQAQELDKRPGLSSLILLLALFLTSATIVIYLVRFDGLSQLREKVLSKSIVDKGDIEGAKMNFRGQNGTMLIQQDSTSRPSESLSGLIKLNDLSGEYFNKTDQLDQEKPLMHNIIDDEMMLILRQEKILVERNRLTLGHVLGSGQFGRVYKGFLKAEHAGDYATVAVKTLHNRCHWDDSDNHQAFLEEGLMMKDFNHENVLALIGVTFDSNGLPMVITPFMLYGDLRSYISDEASSPTVKELIEFGIQVAKGMAYLSNLKFVHRDLAARNCMLDENLVVKVADFGLSRDIYERDYYSSDNRKAKLPVKWMAIESLERSIYSTKTDVWSFGVLLWELMTRGVVPYPDVDNFDLFSYLKEGRRMLRPRYCPMSLYKIMLACWDVDPEVRPTFNELVTSVSNVIVQLQEAKDSNGQQKVSRDETYCDVVR